MSGAPLNPAAQSIFEKIKRDGFMAVEAYMAAVVEAYYARGDVFGRGGDFITAPEISQTFGEIIGLWCAVTWQKIGGPSPVRLIECGPGRGTLMADALRATQNIPDFATAEIHLVERSPALRALQRAALKGRNVTWHDDLSTVPEGSFILIANEFLDALPVRQFQRTQDGWAERGIRCPSQGHLSFATMPVENAPVPIPLAISAEVGAIYEHSDAVTATVQQIADRVLKHKGAALLIDYGHTASALGDTLQAVKQHHYHDVLSAPGEADITAHVDFAHVRNVALAAGAAVCGPLAQGIWLRRLGIGLRQVQLAKGKPADVARAIEQGVRRLTEPHGMGAMFKVVAIAPAGLGELEGFVSGDESRHP